MWMGTAYEQSGSIRPVRPFGPKIRYDDGMRLTDEEVASMRRLKASFDQDRGQPLPDLSHTEFCWFVSDQLKSLLETFEPDRHQYIPINLCDYPTQYYLLIVHQTTDCVIPSQTAIRNGMVNFSPSAQRGLDADSIIGLHLWCDP